MKTRKNFRYSPGIKPALNFYLLLILICSIYSSFGQDISTGLKGYWKFDNNLNDETTNLNNASIYNGVIYSDHANGCNNHALSLHGNQQYIIIPNRPDYAFGIGAFTVAHQIKYISPQPYNGYAILTNKLDAGCPQPYIGINMFVEVPGSGNVMGRTSGTHTVNTLSNINLRDGDWHSLVFVRQPDLNGITCSLKIYVDGQLNNVASGIPLDNVTNSSDIYIGANSCGTTSQNYIGEIDNYRLYNRALTLADVQELYTVENTPPVPIIILDSIISFTCNGANSGSIYITAGGGTPPYNYSWSNGATTQDITGLSAGIYSVTVSDDNGCLLTQSYTVNNLGYSCDGSSLVFDGRKYTSIQNSGLLISDDSLIIINTGVDSFMVRLDLDTNALFDMWYNYNTQPGAIISKKYFGRIANVLNQKIATSALTQINDSIQSLSFTFNQPSQLVVTYLNNDNVVSSDTVANGFSINYNNSNTYPGSGGPDSGPKPVLQDEHLQWYKFKASLKPDAPPFSEAWKDYNIVSEQKTTAPTMHLENGKDKDGWYYNLRTDFTYGGSGIIVNDNVVDKISVNPISSDLLTYANSIAYIEMTAINVSGININHSFSITASGNSSICPGSSVEFTCITAPTAIIQWQLNQNDIQGATSTTITTSSIGDYRVKAIVGGDTYYSSQFALTSNAPIIILDSIISVTCNGGNSGSIFITPNGGTPPYNYLWSNGATTQNITGLSVGNYSVTITDAFGCTATASKALDDANTALSIIGITCNGENDGAINAVQNGGASPYSYAWNNGATTQNITGLSAGTYSVIVTDANGCTSSSSGNVSQPNQIIIIDSIISVTCNGPNSGSIYITPNGGTPPYNYSWSNGATTQNISGLSVGNYSVIVIDANGCSANASTTVFSNNFFTNAPDAIVGAQPYSVAIGDFNNDGKLDMAVAIPDQNSVSIRMGDGAGNFTGSTSVPVGTSPRWVSVGDFNGDGMEDIASANVNSNSVSIRLGNGSGNFTGSTEVPVGITPYCVAIGDFNGDGKKDFAAVNTDGNNVSIRIGDGTGNFSGSTQVPAGTLPFSTAVGDFNNDGKQDLAVANGISNSVSILIGDGLGNFSGSLNIPAGIGVTNVQLGDFNNDGHQDIVATNQNSNNISILQGDGSGNFIVTSTLTAGFHPWSSAVGDFNGDGKQDIVTANYGGDVSEWLGDGAGNFTSVTDVSVTNNPYSIAAGDFNNDSKLDFAVADFGANTVSIRLGTCSASSVTLNQNIFLEGYYLGGGMMNNCLNIDGISSDPLDADTIFISAMNSTSPYEEVDRQPGILKTNGEVTVIFGAAVVANTSYYLKINHRNSVETWSAAPVLLTETTSYSFSSATSQAFQSNEAITFDALYAAIYTGDINHDGAVDGTDFLELDPAIQNGDGGYVIGDLTGDGAVDGTDFLLLDPNIQNGRGAAIPTP